VCCGWRETRADGRRESRAGRAGEERLVAKTARVVWWLRPSNFLMLLLTPLTNHPTGRG